MDTKTIKDEIGKLLAQSTFAINYDVIFYDQDSEEQSFGAVTAGTADIKFSYIIGEKEFKSDAFRYFFVRNLKSYLKANVASLTDRFQYVKKGPYASTVNTIVADFDSIEITSRQHGLDFVIPKDKEARSKILADLISEPVEIAKAILVVGNQIDQLKESASAIDMEFVSKTMGHLVKMNETITHTEFAERILKGYGHLKADAVGYFLMENPMSINRNANGIDVTKQAA